MSGDDDDRRIRNGLHDTDVPMEDTLHIGALTIIKTAWSTQVNAVQATKDATTDTTQKSNLTTLKNKLQAAVDAAQDCINRSIAIGGP